VNAALVVVMVMVMVMVMGVVDLLVEIDNRHRLWRYQ
jgi:type II secretory pathway component PulK